MHQKNGMNNWYSSVSPGPLAVTMYSRPNDPPVAYAYITNTNGSNAALRIGVRLLFSSVELAVRLSSEGPVLVRQRVSHSLLHLYPFPARMREASQAAILR